MNEISFILEGQPMAQGRARFSTQGGKMRTYDPKGSVNYKDSIRTVFYAARNSGDFHRIDEGPVKLSIVAKFDRPKSSYSKRAPKPLECASTGRDVDNVAKIVMDALNCLAWKDDRQVSRLTVEKYIQAQGDAPYLMVHISSLPKEGL